MQDYVRTNKEMNMKKSAAVLTVLAVLSLAACTKSDNSSDTAQSTGSSTSSSTALMGKVSLTVKDSGGNTVYSDTDVNSSLVLKAGETYTVVLEGTNIPAGATFTLQGTQTNLVSGQTLSTPLQVGSTNFIVPVQGDYTLKLIMSSPGQEDSSRFYQAEVTCPNSTFTKSSLNAAAISVAAGAGSNLYNFSAAGVTAGANGTPPYTCAWDPTGTGIVDTGYSDCAQTLQNFYSNNVSTRNVGLIVKDSCNTTYAISKSLNLAYTEPSMPGNVFIFGQTSNGTGVAATDSRVSNLDYLATNSGGNNIVQPSYGGGKFDIYSQMDYNMSSSVKFGINIQLEGITDNINLSAGTGTTVDVSNATIKSLAFTTDQAGDQAPPLSFGSSSCTLSNQGAKVQVVAGQPCSAGTSGDNNKATVEVFGHYKCNMTGPAGTMTLEGDFDGFDDLVDNCTGGGGGGGGIVPITK
ncbi:MAG: hypothetical protein C5B49_11620 [Bdellovibrio sp.]|nr:MAG: hypothetical protein C5B49_11620 [Bdellovibrio sp.]